MVEVIVTKSGGALRFAPFDPFPTCDSPGHKQLIQSWIGLSRQAWTCFAGPLLDLIVLTIMRRLPSSHGGIYNPNLILRRIGVVG